jgi:hypothetical protein
MASQISYDALIAAVSKKPSDTCTIEMYMPSPRKDLVNNFLNPVLNIIDPNHLALAHWGSKSN